jgi:hypothetical protein
MEASRRLTTNVEAPSRVPDRSLTPGDHPRIGSIRFADWLKAQQTPNKEQNR